MSARLRRPTDVVIPSQAVSAIPSTGGVSESAVKGGSYHGNTIRFDDLYTKVDGNFLDSAGAVNFTYGNWNANPSHTKTVVQGNGRGITVINAGPSSQRVMTIDSFDFATTTIARSNQPSEVTLSAEISGLRLDGAELRVTMSTSVFNQYSTLDSLASAYEQYEAFFAAHGHQFFPPVPTTAGGPRMFPAAYGNTAATVVEKIEWVGSPLTSVTIDGNAVIFPGFGVIHLGELNLTRFGRTVTMVRLELGSPDGGENSWGEGSGTGNDYP